MDQRIKPEAALDQELRDTSTTGPRFNELVFEVTPRCNHDCMHCYNVWKNPRPYPSGELGTMETLAMLDQVLDESGATNVTLTGGEPLLRQDLFVLVEHLRQRGVTVDLITNGTLLEARAIEQLIPDRIGVFQLPLLSADAEVHDHLSGQPGAFDRVTLAIAELKAAQQRVIAVYVATRLNLPTLPETIELAFALGVDALMFNRFNPGGRGFANMAELQLSPEQLHTALDQASALSVDLELPISCSIAMPPCLFDHDRWSDLTFGFCAAGTEDAYFTLDALGNLRPCNHSSTILANVRHGGFRAAAASTIMRNFMAARPAFCSGCAVEDQCLGGCKAAAEVCCGDLSGCDPFLAAFRQQAVKR